MGTYFYFCGTLDNEAVSVKYSIIFKLYLPKMFFDGAGGTIFPNLIYLLASSECIPRKSLKRRSVLNSVRLNLGMLVFVVTLEKRFKFYFRFTYICLFMN